MWGEVGGTIIIPETAKQMNHRGWVLNVSPNVNNMEHPTVPVDNPLDLVGCSVSWGQWAGRALAETAISEKWDGEYLQIAWDEVLGIQLQKGETAHGG